MACSGPRPCWICPPARKTSYPSTWWLSDTLGTAFGGAWMLAAGYTTKAALLGWAMHVGLKYFAHADASAPGGSDTGGDG